MLQYAMFLGYFRIVHRKHNAIKLTIKAVFYIKCITVTSFSDEIMELLKADGVAFLGQVKDCGVIVEQ